MKLTSVCLLVICGFSAGLIALGVSPALAVTVVADGFDDGNNTSVPDGIDWYVHSGAANTVFFTVLDDSAGLGSGNALRVEPISTGLSIMGVFGSPISVPAGIGSKLTLSFDIRNNNGGSPPGGTFRFGLYDADEAVFPNPAGFGGSSGDWDAAQPGSQFDTGPFVQLDNAGNNSGNAGGCCTRLREEIGNDGSTQHGGNDVFNLAAPAAGSVFPGLNESDGKNTITLEIERLAAGIGPGSLRYTYTLDNGLSVGTLTGLKRDLPVLTSDTFDYVSMFYDGNNEWLIDNVRIAAVPEPASWLLVAAAAVGSRFRRRK